MVLRNGLISSSSSFSRTPALRAAVYMSSSKMSHPVKTRSFNAARDTNSLIRGERPSVRFPRRMVPIWVSDPIGFDRPLRTASTPATKVVATAPIPGIITPSLPLGAFTSLLLSDLLPAFTLCRLAILLGCFLMSSVGCRQTFMFSYQEKICNLSRPNARDRKSMACQAHRVEEPLPGAGPLERRRGTRSLPTGTACLLIALQFHCLDRQVPMRIQDLKAPLLFPFVGFLIRPELLLDGCLVESFVGHGRVPEDNGHTIVPAPVFGGVVAGLVHPDFQHPSHLDFFPQQRIVVLLEQSQELVRMSPPGLVVILDDERLIRSATEVLGGEHGRRNEQHRERSTPHESSHGSLQVSLDGLLLHEERAARQAGSGHRLQVRLETR